MNSFRIASVQIVVTHSYRARSLFLLVRAKDLRIAPLYLSPNGCMHDRGVYFLLMINEVSKCYFASHSAYEMALILAYDFILANSRKDDPDLLSG